MTGGRSEFVGVVVSVLAHAVAGWWVHTRPASPPPTLVSLMEVSVVPAPPPQPVVEPAPTPSAKPAVVGARRARARRAPSRPPAQASTNAPAPLSTPAPPPVDFGGLTLTNGEGSWAVATSAQRLRPAPRPQKPPRSSPVFVNAGDLSRRPAPPSLGPRLQRLYPREARAQGLEGEASLSVRILANGRVGSLRTLRASTAAFATACHQLLQDSRWTPPLDRRGRPVGTEVRYRCRFRID